MLRFNHAFRWAALGVLMTLGTFVALGQPCGPAACAPGTTSSTQPTPLSLPPQGLSRGDAFVTTLSGSRFVVVHAKEGCNFCDLALEVMLRDGNVTTSRPSCYRVTTALLERVQSSDRHTKKRCALLDGV